MSAACVTDDNRPKVAKNCADNTELSSLNEVNTIPCIALSLVFEKNKHVMQKSR